MVPVAPTLTLSQTGLADPAPRFRRFALTDLDEHRLPSSIAPTAYDLVLAVDLDGARFDGEVTITLDVREATRVIECHASELEIGEVRVSTGDRIESVAEVRTDVPPAPEPVVAGATGPATGPETESETEIVASANGVDIDAFEVSDRFKALLGRFQFSGIESFAGHEE